MSMCMSIHSVLSLCQFRMLHRELIPKIVHPSTEIHSVRHDRRPPIRMAAIMEVPSIFIFTHDSIGVGEDGPTHQPVEQLCFLGLNF